MEETCSIHIYRVDAGYVFRIIGRGTLRESPAVRDFVCGAMDDGADVLVDLNRCEHLDSTFLGCLVILSQRNAGQGGSFHVVADEPTKRKLFSTSHLDKILAFVELELEDLGDPVTLQVTKLERREFCRHLVEAHRELAELGGPSAKTFQRIVDQLRHDLEAMLP